MWLLWLILLVIAGLLFYQYGIVRRRLPPGPFPLPLVGNSLSLRGVDRWEEKFLEWRQKYGPVYTFFSGPLAIVTVNDLDLMQQVDGDTYNEKFKMKALFELTRGGDYGLVATDGDLWREQRRFALRTLRDFGLGKDEMSRRILEEVQYLCSTINRQLEGGTAEFENFHKLTDIAVGSVINSFLAGYRFSDGKEEEFYKLKQTLDKVMKSFADPFVLMGILSDWLRGLPVFKQRVARSIGLMNEIFDFMRSVVDKHEQQSDYETMEEPADFIDAFLMEKNKLDKAGESHFFSRIQLLNACLDMWIAGQETSSHTITWAIALLIVHPEIQRRVQKELDEQVGSDRLVRVSDRPNLPFLNACIMEVQRWANIVVLNQLRVATKDIEVGGVRIPKGAAVSPQIAVVMCNPKYFADPKRFNPTRFLDESGRVKHPEELVPFSLGKRACLGESLAKMELFLFIGNLFHQYRFSAAKQPPSLKRQESGASMGTEPYACRVERRFRDSA